MTSEATIERYRDAAIALLPPGRAYSKDPESNVGKLLEALTVEFARVHESAAELISNRTPLRADAYIADWEEALGLPGTCVASPSTVLSERQGAAVAKLLGRTSHNRALYEAVAKALGYDVAIDVVTFPPATCAGDCQQSVYGDEWANVVRIEIVDGDQEASAELECTFADQLRRAHGFVDLVLEGVMGASRIGTANYFNNATIAADMVVANLQAVSVRYGGHVSIQCRIDNGAGAAPSDTPAGVWELWCSSDGVTFTQYTNSAIVTELAKIAPNGNNLVEAWAVFEPGNTPGGIPGTSFKLRYNATSGGAGNSRATVHITTW